jgi:hypothetical protein
MGKHPALIMRDYELIQGRLAKKADAMLRDFQASGGRVRWTKYSDDGVTGVFSHPFCPEPITVDWDFARAERAGLTSKGGMYHKYGRPMYRSRCITEGVRACAPECTEQMYSPQEFEGIVDDNPPVATIEKAVTDAVEHVEGRLSQEKIDELVATLDVKTMPELKKAFALAYPQTKDDEKTRQFLTNWYESMKEAINNGTIEPEAGNVAT